jgi:hypothetical protein
MSYRMVRGFATFPGSLKERVEDLIRQVVSFLASETILERRREPMYSLLCWYCMRSQQKSPEINLNVLICGSWLKGGEFLWRILFEPCFDTIPDCLYGHVFLLFLTAFLARSLPSHSNPSRNFWKRPGLLSFVIRVANLSVGNGQSFG